MQQLSLFYPPHWFRERNALAQEAEYATLFWLRQHGVINNEQKERDFFEMGVADYAGRPFPLANAEGLEFMTKVLTLWLLYDDDVEGLAETEPGVLLDSVCGVRRALGQEGAELQDSPVHRAWLDLGALCKERMSARWMARHRTRFAQWLRSLESEAELVRSLRTSGGSPDLNQYLAVRMITIGVVPTLDYVEFETGLELPESFHQSEACYEMVESVTLLVLLQNDIAGLNKDKKQGWINGALSASGPDGDELKGLRSLVRLHDEAVNKMDRLDQQFRRHPCAAVRSWSEHLCLMVGGWSCWHLAAARYDSELQLTCGDTVRVMSGVQQPEGAARRR